MWFPYLCVETLGSIAQENKACTECTEQNDFKQTS